MTIREIANETLYTEQAAIEALCRAGYYIATADEFPTQLVGIFPSLDVKLSTAEEATVRGILRDDTTKKAPVSVRATAPTPTYTYAPTPTPTPTCTPAPTPARTVDAKTAPINGEKSEQFFEERRAQLLSYDLILLTEALLVREPAAELMLRIVKLWRDAKSPTRIAVYRTAADRVRTSSDPKYATVAAYLEKLKGHPRFIEAEGDNEADAFNRLLGRYSHETRILCIGSAPTFRAYREYLEYRQRDAENRKSVSVVFCDWTKNFRITTSPRALFETPEGKTVFPDSPVPVTHTATVGESVTVTGSNRRLQLGAEIGKGAEGSVYLTEGGTRCVKIFSDASRTRGKLTKLRLMMDRAEKLRAVNAPLMSRIAWPEATVTNALGEEIGYVMPYFADTDSFEEFTYDGAPKLRPDFKKADQVEMAISFTELITFLHEFHVVLGDINRANIRFDKHNRAYLIDLDSAQICDETYAYPCDVGMPEYLSPEHIYDKDFRFIRRTADDCFALTMMLFRMLTPDGDPYATSEDVDDAERIARGLYPYQSPEHHAEQAIAWNRDDFWHMVVGCLPKHMKSLFWESLHGEGRFFRAERRLYASNWLSALESYRLKLPEMCERDAVRGMYIPTSRVTYMPQSQNRGILDRLLATSKSWDA